MREVLPTANLIQKKLGFTLIEVLITISVISIILSVGVVQYNEFSKTQLIKSATLNFKNILRDTQAKATSGLKPACEGSNTLTGYLVKFELDARTYTTQAQCSGGTNNSPELTYTLPSGVKFNPLPTNFTFNVLDGSTNLTSAQTISISYSNSSQGFGLSITPTGEITDLGAVSITTTIFVVNERTGEQCEPYCQSLGYSGCAYMTTDTSLVNHSFYVRRSDGTCGIQAANPDVTCWTQMLANSPNRICNGHRTLWTYCACIP